MANTAGSKPASEATLREHFAAMAMQGIISIDGGNNAANASQQAVVWADALLAALEKQS